MTATIRQVDAGGVDLSIAETGVGGRPLLMLHGFTGAKEDFADHWDWLAQRGWHVVAPDLRGHGSSAHPTRPEDYSLETFEADVMALVDLLGWGRFVLLGHSMGGMVSQAIALRTDRLDGLILMDTIAGPVTGGGLTLLIFKSAGRLFSMKTMARFARKPPPKAPESVRRLYAERPGYGEEVQAKILASSPVMARSMMSQLGKLDDRVPALRSLDLPVLVIAGEHDMPGFAEGSRIMAEAIPGADLLIIDGAAHSPQLETPEPWIEAVSGFLDGLSAPTSARLDPKPTTDTAEGDTPE